MRPEDEIVEVELLPDEPVESEQALPPEPPSEPRTRLSLFEQVLNPHALQWMMICGGGMLILGFVIWLWSVGIFENPIVVASVVGAATMGTLAAGVAMVRLTKYQLAGRGIALLGSIALPLNLWLYDAQGLVTLADGGHLWVPAALCCLIYAGVARMLRDSNFVYALVGGVVMTGMLFLADETIGRIWEIMPPVTFLVAVGWISSLADRLFNDDDGDFSRKNFGLAFHRAGLLVVVSGLALLLGNHAIHCLNWLVEGLLSRLVSDQPQEIWSLGIIAASAAGFGLQSVIHRSRFYQRIAALLAVWAVPVTLNALSISVSVSHLAIVVALLVIAGNLFVARLRSRNQKLTGLSSTIVNAVEECSLAATSMVCVLALAQFFAQFTAFAGIAFFSPLGWLAVFQILTAGLAACATGCRALIASEDGTGQSKTSRSILETESGFMVGAGVILTTLAAFTAIKIQTIMAVQAAVTLVLLLPVMVAVASIFADGTRFKGGLQLMAAVLMTAHLVMRGVFHFLPGVEAQVLDFSALQWSGVLLLAAAVYWAASLGKSYSASRVMSYLSSTFAVALVGHYFGFSFGYCLVLAPMVVGTAMRVFETLLDAGKATAADKQAGSLTLTANSLVLGAGIGGVLMALSHWLSGDTTGTLMWTMLAQLTCLTVTSLLTTDKTWRTSFRALIVGTIGASLCVFDGWLDMDGWKRLELGSLLSGSILLVLGHMTWMREDGETDDVASLSLVSGSLLVAVPLAMGLLVYRLGFAADGNWMQFHEITAVAAALALFGAGVLCRLRATTIAGAGLLGVYLVSLLTLIRLPGQLQNVSVMMMLAGGIFFGVALLMSVYRDRLTSLPRRIREGEGVYQILKWR